MAESLKWVLELKDALSAPAQAAAGSLVQLQIELKQTERQLTSLEKAAHGFTVGKGLLGLATGGLSLVGDIVGGVQEAVTGFAKLALSGYSFREETTIAFQQLLGTAEGANSLFENALRVAKLTKFETRDVVTLYSDLLAGGFKVGDLNTLVAGLADVGTAKGAQGPEKMAQLEHALLKVQSQGKLTADALGEISLVVSRTDINTALAKSLGIKETDTKKLSDKVAAILKKGAVDATTGIGAVMDAIRTRLDPGGQLGDLAKAQSETLAGVYSNFKEGFANLFMSPETQSLSGFKTLKETLKLVSGFMDGSTAKGKQLLTVVNRLVEDLLRVVQLDPANAEKSFDKMLGWLEGLEGGVKRLTTWISDELMPAISNAFNQQGGIGATLTNVLAEMGKVIGAAVVEGAKEALGYADAKRTWHANRGTKEQPELRDVTGEVAGAGIQRNMENAIVLGPAPSRPQGGSFAPAAASQVTNLGGVQIQIQGVQDPQANAAAVEQQLQRLTGRLNRAPSRAER